MKKAVRAALASVLSGLLLCQPLAGLTAGAAEETTVYLSDMAWTDLSVGWGSPGIDENLNGGAIAIRDEQGVRQTYAKGLVLHAPSEISFDITDSGAETFQAVIGIDDNDQIGDRNASSCGFIVEIDGEAVYTSEVLRINSGGVDVSVDIPADAHTLTLITTDGGDGNGNDHSAWADARLLLDPVAAGRLRTVSLSAETRLLDVGDTLSLQPAGRLAAGTAADLSEADIVYTTSDEMVASVSADGRVTALSAGPVTVTAAVTLDGVTREGQIDLLVAGESADKQVWDLASPDGQVEAWFALTGAGQPVYALQRQGRTVVDVSPLGFQTSEGDYSTGLALEDAGQDREIDETYSVLSSRKDTYENHARERTFTFAKAEGALAVTARAYDDGLAFRYTLTPASGDALAISGEATGCRLPAASTVWAMPYASGAYNYEGLYSETAIEDLTGGQATPLLYQTPDGDYALLAEAMLDGSYVGTQLVPQDGGLLQAAFVPQQTEDVTAGETFTSPWRTVITGDLSAIVEGSMIENVSDDPDTRADYSWVQPGGTAWSWIAESAMGQREAQHDPDIIKEYIDLAYEMGWKYFIMDEGWQPPAASGSGYEGYYDWFDEIVDYADERGIGLIAWVLADDLDTPEKRAARLDDWAAKGIKGIKVDFFDRESQERLELQETIYEYCADLEMVVIAHGTNKPTGEVRTNPNVLTREAIRGREYGGMSVEQYTMLAFTRTAIGPADVTETVYPAGGESAGFMNALSVLVQSGIHCYAGAPEDYLNSPVYTLYKDMPVTWDDIRLVDGYPGDYVALARRSGESWYGAAISVEARTVEFPLDMLDDGTYYAYIYKDGASRNEVELEIQQVTKDSVLEIPVAENGGCAIKVVREVPDGPESITLSAESLTLEEREQAQLTAEITPADAQINQIIWRSSDESVATVSADGRVTGIQAGRATITATSPVDSAVTASCTVQVTPPRYALDTDNWEIVRENSDNLRFADENTVQITMEKGDVGEMEGSDRIIKNIIRMTPADEDFTLTVKVSGNMTASFQTAALIAYTDESNLIAAMRRYHGNFGGNIFEHMTYLGGYNEKTTGDANPQADAWLKLEKQGSIFISSYSFDGGTWTEIGREEGGAVAAAQPGELKIGIYAAVGSGENAEMTVSFSDFTYTGASGRPQLLPFAVEDVTGLLERARTAAEDAVDALTPSNTLSADAILEAVTTAVDGTGVTAAWTTAYSLEPATDTSEGRIQGAITLTYGEDSVEIPIQLTIPPLGSAVIKGDLTGDGLVRIEDVMAACRILARQAGGDEPTDAELERGDLTGDGHIRIEDIMSICRILARQN